MHHHTPTFTSIAQPFFFLSWSPQQDVLKKSCNKKIGNGRSTCVWNQPWLPDVINPFIISSVHGQYANLQVSELVLPQTNDWDLNKLSGLFVQRDIELITQIPISINFEDKWCWRGDLRGLLYSEAGLSAIIN
nr:uncharacterized protein LOC109176397 [Ipomoea batatas]